MRPIQDILTDREVPTQRLDLPEFRSAGITVDIRREDLLDEEISGNKWRKLRYILLHAQEREAERLVTFGGAYSNHVLAIAKAAHLLGLRCLLLVRGDPLSLTNTTLSRCLAYGADIHFLDRTTYREKESTLEVQQILSAHDYLIAEGGNTPEGIRGCMEILKDDEAYDIVACPQGTGGTAAGLLLSLRPTQRLFVFPALKGDFFSDDIRESLQAARANSDVEGLIQKLDVMPQYHFGGYSKYTPQLMDYMSRFHESTGILLDPIYTGKMLFGLSDMAMKGKLRAGQRILVIHTGGLQGRKGFVERFGPEVFG